MLIKHTLLLLATFAFASLASTGFALDFGDSASGTLTTKAWEALNADKAADAVTFAKKCIELYEKEAINMQKGLKAPVEGEDEAVAAKWALNDVGTCYFIMGKAFEKQKKTKEARAAYKTLTEKLAFAQCWDPNGWFWKPAKAAKEHLALLKEAAPAKEKEPTVD